MDMDEWRKTAPEYAGYLAAQCPNESCGRRRLELFVEPETEKALGVECEKCGMQWIFDPNARQYGEYDMSNPLKPPRPDINPFKES